MKIVAYSVLVLSSLLVLLWPVAAYGSIFMFDAPKGSAHFEFGRYAMVAGILSYPWAYLAGIARIIARKKGQEWWTRVTVAFFLIPFAQLALVYLVVTAFSR